MQSRKRFHLFEDPLDNEQSLMPGSCQAIPKPYKEGFKLQLFWWSKQFLTLPYHAGCCHLKFITIIHSQTHLSASEHYLPILNTSLSNFGCHCLFSDISMLFRTPTFDFRQYFKSFRHFCLSLDVIICVWTPLSHFVPFFQFLGSFVCFLTLKFVWFFFFQPLLPNFSVQRT